MQGLWIPKPYKPLETGSLPVLAAVYVGIVPHAAERSCQPRAGGLGLGGFCCEHCLACPATLTIKLGDNTTPTLSGLPQAAPGLPL